VPSSVIAAIIYLILLQKAAIIFINSKVKPEISSKFSLDIQFPLFEFCLHVITPADHRSERPTNFLNSGLDCLMVPSEIGEAISSAVR